MKIYILTYNRLRKREPLIAHNFSIRGTQWGWGWGTDLNTRLAEIVPTCLVIFYDIRSGSSGIFYYPIPAGGRERERESEREREKGKERELGNLNSKTVILMDSSIRSAWTCLTATPRER